MSVSHYALSRAEYSLLNRVLAFSLAIALSALPTAAAPSDPELPNPGPTGVSKEQQKQIGAQAAGEVYKQMPILPDSSPEAQYVRQLGQKLVAVIPAEYSWPYEFHVIPQKEINAFALPGGPIFVNAGTITAADSEAELAGVLAHEMSHVYMQHSIKQANKAQWTQTIGGVLGDMMGKVGGTVGILGQLGAQVAGGMLTMKYSRTDEAQADAVGAIIMYKAGYDPHSLAQFFEKLASSGSSGPQFLSDHPNPGNRQQAISEEVQNWPTREFVKESQAFASVKQHAQTLKTYSAQEISDGAKSGLWAQQNRQSGAMPASAALTPVGDSKGATDKPASNPASTASPEKAVSSSRKLSYEVDIPGASQWTDTAIDLVPGDRVAIIAIGNIQTSAARTSGPDGLTRGWRDLLRALPVNNAGSGALIGRVGDSAAAVPFMVGANKEVTANNAGRLFLGINQLVGEQGTGSFHVTLKITPAVKSEANAPTAEFTFPANLLGQFPRRVADANGNPGDLVNFVLIGSEKQVQSAFQSAGWVKVDRTKGDAVLHAVLSSTSKQSYVEMPMSELYLFGRPQDFGFARAEPVEVVSTRHHLRVWKAPFQYQGDPVWLGAATHDIGFEKDQRTGGVTHKIDPKVDLERDYVGKCFQEAGALSGSSYVLPPDAVREARTATGGAIQSDGRVLILVLRH